MRGDRLAFRLAVLGAAAAALVALWGYRVVPDRPFRWVVVAGIVPALWAFVEAAQERGRDPAVGREIMTAHRWTMAWMGLLLAVHVGLALAYREHLLSAELAVAGRRIAGVLVGVGLVWFGNRLPTLRSPWPTETQPFAWQHVHRFAGWACVLGGLGTCVLWLTLPVATAERATSQLLALVMILAVGRKAVSLIARYVAPPPART